MKMGRRETPFLAPRNAARFNNGKHAHSYLCIHPQCKPAILLYFCTHMYSSTVRSQRMPKCRRARMKGEILQTLRSHHPSGGCSSRVYLPTQAVLKYLFIVQYCKIFKQREFGAATAHTAPPARRPDESAASQNLNLDKPESHGKLEP